jgi:6-pyruvoyltetrahydropterin/6-carboxytetrahydropterin synthase
MDVTVEGEIDPELGYVMDLTQLKLLVEKEIIDKVDHKNLNLDVDFMKGVLPSTENIAVTFWNQIESKINTPLRKLYSIRIRETINNSVEYRGKN